VFRKRADHLRLDIDERAKHGLQMRVRNASDSVGVERLAIPRDFDQLVQGDGWIRHGCSPWVAGASLPAVYQLATSKFRTTAKRE
jgi:hypothetical protein